MEIEILLSETDEYAFKKALLSAPFLSFFFKCTISNVTLIHVLYTGNNLKLVHLKI